jgi:hypothetical protein
METPADPITMARERRARLLEALEKMKGGALKTLEHRATGTWGDTTADSLELVESVIASLDAIMARSERDA